MKKLMILGGSRYILPIIEKAHKMGIYVITCDYIPENIAHRFSDEYYNISVIEKDKVLECAKKLNINGIISFACDPGVLTAAYVAEQMKLPFQGTYEAVSILQDKGLFRKFLQDNGFNCPHAKHYTSKDDPFIDIDWFKWPVIVKPTDSAGSKGVTKVEHPEDLQKAIQIALRISNKGTYIIEDFLAFEGYHSSADCFTINGKLAFCTYSDQLFDSKADNPYTPAYIIWPSTMKHKYQEELTQEIQRLMKLLHMKTGIYNIESCVDEYGKPYIMEVSPRGGGCKIAEIQNMIYGVDLIENEIRSAVGMPLLNMHKIADAGHWCEMIVHAQPGQNGKLKEIFIDSKMRSNHIKIESMSVKKGDIVSPFTGANMALGDIFLRFNTREELVCAISQVDKWLRIELESK